MSLFRTLGFAALLVLPACHFEDHTPAGSRRDEAQIREVVVEFYRGLAAMDWGQVRNFFAPGATVSLASRGDSTSPSTVVPADSALLAWARLAREKSGARGEARILRADLRQADGVAAVWVSVRLSVPFRNLPGSSEGSEGVEHLVLNRTPDGWRIVLLSLPWSAR